MVVMKELEELTADIRNKLPRLMELSEGCIFSMENASGLQFNYKVLQMYGGGQIADTGDYDDVYLDISSDWDGIEERCYLDVIERKAEIIGKEPMLNDVVEFMGKKNNDLFMNLSGSFWKDGNIDTIADHESYMTEIIHVAQWDLSKPYLKDQSPELINFLHGLINH